MQYKFDFVGHELFVYFKVQVCMQTKNAFSFAQFIVYNMYYILKRYNYDLYIFLQQIARREITLVFNFVHSLYAAYVSQNKADLKMTKAICLIFCCQNLHSISYNVNLTKKFQLKSEHNIDISNYIRQSFHIQFIQISNV